MRVSAVVLSNNILQRGKRDNVEIPLMKLHRLLYYVCVRYAKKTKELPISEHFEVWKYGPVLPSVYSEFEPFRAQPITNYAFNAKGIATIVDESCNPIFKDCLDYVWAKFKSKSGIELSELTHQKGSGWYSAFQRYSDTISTKEMINDRTL